MKRILALDGLRGLAAVTVVIAHYFGEVPGGVERLQQGWLGVEVFFVLSGFLIGSIILRDADKPGFYASFYLKRTVRILPVYFITLAAVFAAWMVFGGAAWFDAPQSPGVYLIFGQNIVSAISGVPDTEWLRPAWTLAVEEQFYVLLPLLICFCPKRALPYVLALLWASATGFRVAFEGTLAGLLLLPARIDLFIAGVGAAWALTRFDLSRYVDVFRVATIPLLICGPVIHVIGGLEAFMIYGQGILALGIASFILATALGAPDGKALLTSPALLFFGQISYALYLFHQPLNHLLHGVVLGARPALHSPEQVFVTVLAAGCSVGAAWLSWLYVEAPLLDWAKRFTPARKAAYA